LQRKAHSPDGECLLKPQISTSGRGLAAESLAMLLLAGKRPCSEALVKSQKCPVVSTSFVPLILFFVNLKMKKNKEIF